MFMIERAFPMLQSVAVIGARLMVGLIGASPPSLALADDAIVPEIRLQEDEANGWSLRSFDFGDDDINFETYVPDTARVETTSSAKKTDGRKAYSGSSRRSERTSPISRR